MRSTYLSLLLLCSMAAPASAEEALREEGQAKFQTTYIWQAKPALGAAYSSPNSLAPQREKSYSFTATAFLGTRLWEGGEAYFNPEIAQGVPLSGLTGLGGFSNGEMARTSGANPKLYRARAFLRQTWNLGGGQEAVEPDFNQMAGVVDKHRFVFTAGNLSVTDIFDDNAYSHDPRTQFMNWSIMTHGAYDFAADARGYSWGLAGEWYRDDWAVRFGRFMQPKEPNQLPLDKALSRHYGDQVEIERGHAVGGQPGKVRLLAFRSRAVMSRFRDALDLGGGPPDINRVRNGEHTKTGVGLNVEQALGDKLGAFLRASRADGKTETYAFTEIDQSVSGGLVMKGAAWGREKDSLGLAFARNGISKERRDYLAAGGISFFIGDGALNYRPETILETFYSWNPAPGLWLSADYQHIRNPAYNADRGPARFGGLRLHAEF